MFTEREAWIHDQYLTPPEDDRPVFCVCDVCGEEIRDGDEYYKFSHANICEYCMDDARSYADVN